MRVAVDTTTLQRQDYQEPPSLPRPGGISFSSGVFPHHRICRFPLASHGTEICQHAASTESLIVCFGFG